MKTKTLLTLISFLLLMPAWAQTTIDISGDNTSSSYVSYDKSFTLISTKTVDVKMARYCYFSSTFSGTGTLSLYAGGERCYLGTEKGATWPNWTSFTGKVHIFPFKENSSKAGFYGVVLAHGGKSASPENLEDALKSGKVNISMARCHVTLHEGAVICCEANSDGAFFRIGELNTEAGSSVIGYMKTNTRAGYFLLGNLGTNATLAGKIAPPDYSDTHPVGLQCHFSIGDVDSVKLAKTIQRFADAGLQCIITELDMGVPSTTAPNLEEQARNYRVITDIMLNNDNCPNLVIWGLKDNNSWREASNPLLYTAGVEKKPAYYGVRSALRHRVLEREKDTSIRTVGE